MIIITDKKGRVVTTKEGMFIEVKVPKGDTEETLPVFIFRADWNSNDKFQQSQLLQVSIFLLLLLSFFFLLFISFLFRFFRFSFRFSLFGSFLFCLVLLFFFLLCSSFFLFLIQLFRSPSNTVSTKSTRTWYSKEGACSSPKRMSTLVVAFFSSLVSFNLLESMLLGYY